MGRQFVGMTRCRQTSSGYFPRQLEKNDPKEWLPEITTPVLLTFYGERLDDHLGGFASLETGLGGEVSGAKIDVGQFSSSGGDRWTIGGLGFEG